MTLNDGPLQTSVNGSVTGNYTAPLTVQTFPSTGYRVSEVKINSVVQPIQSVYTVPLSSTAQTVAVSFAKISVSITSSVDVPVCSVSPSGTVNVFAGTVVAYTFSPYGGYKLWDITGLPSGFSLDHSLPYAGPVKATFTVPDVGPISIRGVFTEPPPPPPTEDEDVTDPQMTAFFTQMSSQSAKVVASNADSVASLWEAAKMLGGFLLALVFATTWKG